MEISLRTMKTDYVDLWQMHIVPTMREVEQIFGIKTFDNALLLLLFSVSDCLRYVLSLPITATPLGASTIGQIEDDVRIAQNFKPLTPEEKSALVARASSDNLDTIRGPTLEYWKTR